MNILTYNIVMRISIIKLYNVYFCIFINVMRSVNKKLILVYPCNLVVTQQQPKLSNAN